MPRHRNLECFIALIVVLGTLLVSGSVFAEPPILSGLIIDPGRLVVATGTQTVTISVRVSDQDDDLNPNKVKVIVKFADGTMKQKVVLEDAGDGRFSGQLEIDTTARQDISLKVKAKDFAKNKATALTVMLPVREASQLTPVVNSRPSTLDYVDRAPPIASLITVSEAALDGTVTVTGAAGSVPGRVNVLVASLLFRDGQIVVAAVDGSFETTITAAPGGTIDVRYDPFGGPIPEVAIEGINNWPGTFVWAPTRATPGKTTAFTSPGVSLLPPAAGIAWWFAEGTVADRQLALGESTQVSGTVALYLPDGVRVPASSQVSAEIRLEPLFNKNGAQVAAGSSFVSHLLTSNGLPIERRPGPPPPEGAFSVFPVAHDGETFTGTFSLTAVVPSGLPVGTYRLVIDLGFPPELQQVLLRNEMIRLPLTLLHHEGATAGILTVGSPEPPKLSPVLLVETPSQGQRGAIANEDRGRFELADRIVTQSDRYVIEPRDLGTGNLISYRLEPFFPFVSQADRGLPDKPPIPFDLPGGTLAVTMITPSGETKNLGTHPILQVRTGQASTSLGQVLTPGGGNPGSVFQLSTLSDDFAVQFDEYGRYQVSVSGSVPDIWGTNYPFDGIFDIWVAETLDLEAASLPSTPFEVGNRLPAAVNVFPGVPAQIEWAAELHPIDGSPVIRRSIRGTANRFGYFDGDGKTFELTVPGEYLLTIQAGYTDSQGRLWMGTRRWGSGIASPSSGLIAHGTRGIDAQPSGRQAWFLRSATGIPAGGNHISFPYFSGDIVWASPNDAVQMRITIDDREGTVTNLIRARQDQSNVEFNFDERVDVGELPLVLSTGSGIDATMDPSAIDQWGYAYRAVERPGIRVRESTGVDETEAPYWRFQDTYLLQRGMGMLGDLPNDLKWQFGAAVFKRPDVGIGEVAIYGSLFVLIDDEDSLGSRVFPPFQGAGGGPSGGPIMTLKGEEVDLFMLPTTVHPGAVLEVGDRFVVAGQVGPPLDSKITYTVTSPNGTVRTIHGQANAIGYFAVPDETFTVDEPGVWTVHVQVLHDGLTSAGPVESPFPTGGVLGADNGQFEVYVVPSEAPRLDFGLAPFSIADLGTFNGGSVQPIRFFAQVPDGWNEVSAHYTIRMPGFLLESGTLTPDNGVVTVIYDPTTLQSNFPNLDFFARHGSGFGLADEVMVSVLMSGTDATGQPIHAAKLLTLVGEDIYDMN